jgi:hypothetical protein
MNLAKITFKNKNILMVINTADIINWGFSKIKILYKNGIISDLTTI